PDGRGADLLMVADDEDSLTKVQGDQRHNVALAGFIDDDNVEASGAWIEVLYHARKRHDPDGNGPAALAHFSCRFGAQKGNPDAVTFADTTAGVEPADERLTLSRRGAARLRRPRPLVDEFDGHAAKLLAEFFALGLEDFERNAAAAIEFIIQLTPGPGRAGVARRLASTMHSGAIANCTGPCGGSGFELCKQGAAQVEVGLLAL